MTSVSSTATQYRPGVAARSVPRSGSRAKANSSSTTRANGSTWFVATRLRASMRRSLPATSTAALSIRHPPGWWLVRAPARAVAPARPSPGPVAPASGSTAPPDSTDGAVGQGEAALELVGGEHDGGAGRHGLAHEVVEAVAALGVEPGVGLVEQPQLGAAGDERGDRRPAALAGREPSRRACGRRARPGPGWRGRCRSRPPKRPRCGPRTARSPRRSGRRRGGSRARGSRPGGAPPAAPTAGRGRARRPHRR